MKTLEPQYNARALARAKLEESTLTLERARRVESGAADRVRTLEQRAAQAETDQAAQLADLIAAGGPAPTDTEPHVSPELASARHQHTLATKALQTLSDTHAKRVSELQAAEQTVINAVDQIFLEEDIESARVVAHHLDEALRLGGALLHLTTANEMHLNGYTLPREVSAVLNRLEVPLVDRRDVAVNLIKHGDSIAAARRAARRSELIAELTPVNAPAAA
jgi:hypothetical protein